MKRYDAVNTNGDPLYAPSPDGEMVFYSDVAQWVDVNIERPQVDFEVICMADDDVEMCIFREDSDGSYYFDGLSNVTHWQPKPLPLPPSKELSHEG
tara:strand:- start:261 stop:548 length:288 start_codon:yes stop_codon:yes gene_type:complete